MTEPYVDSARGVFQGTVGSTAIPAGSPVYYDGTDWELADADDETKYAEAIACGHYEIGDRGAFCRRCVIRDIDSAAYTQGDQYFLSATAGSITLTRPTGANNLVQCLGFALSANELYIDIPPVREHNVWLSVAAGLGVAATAGSQYDGGNFAAYRMDADAEAVYFTLEIPQNCVGLEIAHVWYGPDTHDHAPVLDFTVSGAVDDEEHDVTTEDSSLTVTCGTVADDVYKADITTAFDATDVWECGNCLGIKCALGTGSTDDHIEVFGINAVLKVV